MKGPSFKQYKPKGTPIYSETASTEPYTDATPMPFGEHKGKALVNVPGSYLIWLYDNDFAKGRLATYIRQNMDALRKEGNRFLNR